MLRSALLRESTCRVPGWLPTQSLPSWTPRTSGLTLLINEAEASRRCDHGATTPPGSAFPSSLSCRMLKDIILTVCCLDRVVTATCAEYDDGVARFSARTRK